MDQGRPSEAKELVDRRSVALLSWLLVGASASFGQLPGERVQTAGQEALETEAASTQKGVSESVIGEVVSEQAYAGVYARHLGSRSQLTIGLGDQGLTLESGARRMALAALGLDRFRTQQAPLELQFLEPSDEGFRKLVLHQGGRRNELFRVSWLESRYREQAGVPRPHAVSDAVLARDLASLRSLLTAGADAMELDQRPGIGGRNGRRPLNWAALLDQPQAIELLLEYGAAIDLPNGSGFTPLHHAAEAGAAQAAAVLLRRGADVEIENARGLSPLDIALRTNGLEVVDLLRSALERRCAGAAESPEGGEESDCSALAGSASYEAPVDRDDGLVVGALDADSQSLRPMLQLLADLERGHYGTVDSLLLAHRGRLVLEQYFNGWAVERPHPLQSISKSVTALLVGSAIQQGHLESVEVPIRTWLPEHAEELEGSERDLTLEHLLTMAAGYDWNERSPSYFEADNLRRQEVLSADPVGFTLAREHVASPGEVFTYSGGYVTVVGEVLANATGYETAAEYLPRSTLARLQLGSFAWLPQGGGLTNTAGGLMMTPRDLVKIGQLMLDGGVWRGERILDESFVDRTLAPLVSTGERWDAYGYFWWGGEVRTAEASYGADAALGFGGQFLILVPELELVVVVNSTEYQKGVPIDTMLSGAILPVFETLAVAP